MLTLIQQSEYGIKKKEAILESHHQDARPAKWQTDLHFR